MFIVKVDSKGSLMLSLPKSDSKVIAIAEAYVAHEATLEPAAQLPLPTLAQVQAALTAAKNHAVASMSGEETRTAASGIFRTRMPVVKQELTWAAEYLKRRHASNIGQLEGWGFNTRLRDNETVVVLPIKVNDWITLLDRYVTKESSLTPAEQLPEPVLADMTVLRDEVLAVRWEREQAYNQRVENIEARRRLVQTLRDLLQAAALNRILFTYGGQLTNALRAWGFPVTYRTPVGDSAPAAPETTEPETTPAGGAAMSLSPAAELAPVGNGTVNGLTYTAN